MEYKLKGENNYDVNNIVEQVLKNRGVYNKNEFFNISSNVLTNHNTFKNMDRAVKCIIEHINKNNSICIIVDSDVDGITSATILYKYIKTTLKYNNVTYIIHNTKTHGIIMKEIQPIINKIDLLIVPDGGSENYKQHKWLSKRLGIDIIILDHHPVKYESKNAIVVNNQLSNVSKNLSGAGIVHKFCEALDEELWENGANNYLDLVALGIISDMVGLNDLEIQWYIREGLSKIKNKMFKALLDQQEFSLKGELNPVAISFYITPTINSVFRLGDKSDVENLFKAFIGIDDDKTFIYTPKTGKNKGVDLEETIYQLNARKCISFNGKRKRLSDKLLDEINDKVNFNDKILVVDIGLKYGENGMARLVANGFSRKYGKPTIAYYKGKDGKLKGSMAANTGNFRDKLNQTELFEFVSGHQDASGLEIKKDKECILSKELNKVFKNEEFKRLHNIDFDIPFEDMEAYIVDEIYQLHDYFGQKFEEPLILINNIIIDSKNINIIGKTKNTLKIEADNISYIKFNSSQKEYDEMIGWNEYVTLNIIGRCSINEYEGKRQAQIIIEEYEILENDSDVKDIKINEEITDDWEW